MVHRLVDHRHIKTKALKASSIINATKIPTIPFSNMNPNKKEPPIAKNINENNEMVPRNHASPVVFND